jgi:hypothetical protein
MYEYLHKVAKAQYGDPLHALEWVEATLTRLYMGKVGWVLGGLRRMLAPLFPYAVESHGSWGTVGEPPSKF